MRLNVAIDGPVGAGKSSVADAVAARLGILHLDTGAMYRALGLTALRRGMDLQDEAAIVRAAVRELPPHLRAATVFRYYEDLTIPEIARILAVREGTVKSRLHEAKCRIRERIARTIRPDAPSNGTEIEQ